MEAPAAIGLKCTVSTVDWPCLRVAGKPPPDTEKPVPVAELDLTTSDALPVDVRVIDFVTAVPTATSPNCKEEVLSVNAGEDVGVFDGFSRSETLRDEPFAIADTVAVWALALALMFAVNDADVDPAAMVAVAGTTTALLVLANATVTAFGDLPFSVAVHAVLPAPVNVVVAQMRDFS